MNTDKKSPCKIALLVNPQKDTDFSFAEGVARAITNAGAICLVPHSSMRAARARAGFPKVAFVPDEEICESADVVAVVGGDGTLLHVATAAARVNKPVLGINQGKLGFLTECEPGDVAATVAEIVGGVCHVEPRTLLELSDILPDIDRAQGAPLALNEFALTRADGVRLPEFEVLVDGLRVDTYRADGFIVATPTGSTAYALSCGGPVLFPGIGGILLVPICSHSLHARPVVITDESAVTINAATPFPATVSADGQVVAQTDAFTSLTIKKSPTLAHFVRRQGTQFYARLLSKLATRRTDWQ